MRFPDRLLTKSRRYDIQFNFNPRPLPQFQIKKVSQLNFGGEKKNSLLALSDGKERDSEADSYGSGIFLSHRMTAEK